MKRLLISTALTLAASALAQTGGLERRVGDALVGPVRSARIETASYVKQGGALVEGPRRLSSSISYSEDGKRREEEGYAEDGTPLRRLVEVFDDAGRVIEQETYDGRGVLQSKVVSRPDAGEVLTYGPDGKLLRRVVTVRGEGGVTETRTYGADGALQKTSVLSRTDEGGALKEYDADGSLRAETTARRAEGGRVETQRNDASGKPVARRVATQVGGAGDTEVSVERPRANQFEKTRVTREFDTRGTVVKSVSYVWDSAAGDLVPSSVTYSTITYYR